MMSLRNKSVAFPQKTWKVKLKYLQVEELEDALYYDLSLVAPAFSVAFSRWNHQRGKNEAVFRVKETMDWDAPPDMDSVDWTTIGYMNDDGLRKCWISSLHEDADEYTQEPAEGCMVSTGFDARTMYICFRCR